MKEFREKHGEGKLKKDDNTKVVITKEFIQEVDKSYRISELESIIENSTEIIAYHTKIKDDAEAELATYE